MLESLGGPTDPSQIRRSLGRQEIKDKMSCIRYTLYVRSDCLERTQEFRTIYGAEFHKIEAFDRIGSTHIFHVWFTVQEAKQFEKLVPM